MLFVGVFFLSDAEMQDRVLTNAVKVVTTSDLIAFLPFPLWHILLIVFIFFFIKRIINCASACFIPL